jgi:hypothetical protein
LPQVLVSLELPKVGLEPTPTCVDRILSPDPNSSKDQSHKEIRDTEFPVVPTVVPSPNSALSSPEIPTDLAAVAAAWDHLPDAIKAGVLALVQAAGGRHG